MRSESTDSAARARFERPPHLLPPLVEMLAVGVFMAAAAGVVLYQAGRVAPLWDVSYILEHAYRMSLGDIPYRDFGIPHVPGTFIVQALLMKVLGASLRHHIVYAATVSSLTLLLTYVTLRLLSRDSVLSLALASPVAISGGFGIYSYPFYDPDCTFWILVALAFLLWSRAKKSPLMMAVVAGILACIPSLFKQNTGLVFLAGLHVLLAIEFLLRADAHRFRAYRWFLAGGLAAAFSFLLLIHFVSGIDRFVYWTFTFPSQRRLPSLQRILQIYRQDFVVVGVLLWIGAYQVVRANAIPRFIKWVLAVILVVGPSTILPALGYFFVTRQFFNYSLNVWQITIVLVIITALIALLKYPKEDTFAKLLALLVCAVVNAAFLSQGVSGSTYGIVPLLSIMLCLLYLLSSGSERALKAGTERKALTADRERYSKGNGAMLRRLFMLQGAIAAVGMALYVESNTRLSYVDLRGKPQNATVGTLAGLNTPGPWIAEMEQMLEVARREIPPDDATMVVPGEDPFHFALQRRPRFPVLTFDRTVNPYTNSQLLLLAEAHGIKWLVVKHHLQLLAEFREFNHEEFMRVFQRDFELYKSSAGYAIYRHKEP